MTITQTIPVFFILKYPILFVADDTSTVMIRKGIYSHVDDTFKDKRNELQSPNQKRFFKLEAYNFAEAITTQTVLDQMESTGRLPACPEHHLAVGYQYPKILSELKSHVNILHKKMAGNPLSPEQAQRFELIERLAQDGKFAIVSLGKAISTSVNGLNVFPGFTNYAFGKGLNLIGYHADRNRLWDPHYFFLAITN